MIDIRKKLLNLLFKNKSFVLKRDNVLLEENSIVDEIPKVDNTHVSKQEEFIPKFIYRRLEKIKINDSFKYNNQNLSGNVQTDFNNLFGPSDSHNSMKVLEHSFIDNYLKIKRSHDIILSFNNDSYNIYNGRHRLIYLKSFYNKCDNLENYYEVPASVSYNVEDNDTNKIITTLSKDYGASFLKGNYYDDELSFIIMMNNKTFVVRNKEELEDFYKNIVYSYNSLDSSSCRYFICEIKNDKTISIEAVFQSIFNDIGKVLFEMSFTDLFFYIKNNGVKLDDKILTLDELDFKAIYSYHLSICEGFQTCKVYDYIIPNGLEITKVQRMPINFCGSIIMDFLYENPIYKELSWNELLEIVSKFTEFENIDSELLKESAIRFGYTEGRSKVLKQKRITFKL